MQVVEELHLARSEKRLEVNVMESYGELTCMDIDPLEGINADAHCKFYCFLSRMGKAERSSML